jgi:hypothetical protein
MIDSPKDDRMGESVSVVDDAFDSPMMIMNQIHEA